MEYLKLARIGSGFAQLRLPIPENHPKLKQPVAPPDFSSTAAPRCQTFAHQRPPNARSARNSNEPTPGLSGDCSGRPLPGCGRRARAPSQSPRCDRTVSSWRRIAPAESLTFKLLNSIGTTVTFLPIPFIPAGPNRRYSDLKHGKFHLAQPLAEKASRKALHHFTRLGILFEQLVDFLDAGPAALGNAATPAAVDDHVIGPFMGRHGINDRDDMRDLFLVNFYVLQVLEDAHVGHHAQQRFERAQFPDLADLIAKVFK